MEVKNNKEEVPFEHYLEEFKEIDPVQRAKELEIPYEDNTFTVIMYGDTYRISWPDGGLACDNENAIAMVKKSGHILLLRFLITGKTLPTTGKYKTFRELPWGEVYLTPFNGRCIARLAYTYNFKREQFKKACEELGGRPLSHSDAGYSFDFIGDYNLHIYLWGGDEEFPPNAQIEFSDNFVLGFSPEDNVVIPELLISAISNQIKSYK